MAERKNRPAKRFTITMQKKLVVLCAIVLLAFLGLGVRLAMITRNNGEEYQRQVLSQQKYDSNTLPYKRGDIVDRNGSSLAVSEKVYNLILDTKAVKKEGENGYDYSADTLPALNKCFGINESEVRTYMASNKDSRYKVLQKQLTYDEISEFLKMQEENEDIQGIWFEEEYRRLYPNGALACDVIGFTDADNKGQFGLEEYYDDVLNGTKGREFGYLNEDNTLERTIKPAQDGNTIVSTIDANVQSIVEKYLKKFNDEHMNEAREGFGANNIGCIMMEVDTGNVLAMASYPNFDLNDPKDISAYYTEEQIAQMEEEGTLYDTYNNLWRNFCISDTYEPGSTAKPFTVAAALDAGTITGDEVYQCNGYREVGEYKIKCHNTYGDGPVSVQQSIEQSCNVGLMYVADTLGATQFCKYQHNFNFGLKTNIDLAGEARTNTLVYDAKTLGTAELWTNSFGQSFNATMIQMITGFCSLINGGNYYEPHMVSRIVDQDGATVKNIEPRVLKQTVSPSVSKKIVQYCNGVVTDGTGKTARPAGYAIGGKTGTAETLPRGNHEYVVSFMGYAPADDPKVAVYVVVDRPNVAIQDDAKYATRIVRSILTECLPYLQIFMTEELSEAEIAELEALNLETTLSYQNMIHKDDVSGNDVSGNEISEGTDTENISEPQEESPGEPGAEEPFVTQVWKTFEVDPETGNYVDPNNGHQIDPETGHDLTDDSVLGAN